LDETLYEGLVPTYIKATLKSGCSLGLHQHNGNSEAYYILSGKGIYNDNGVLTEVEAGDTTFTADGESHGLENAGSEDLVFMALVVSSR
jgi:quercetin dioxygenase-like cupin family protein